MDGRANRLASTEEQAHVQATPSALVVPPPATVANGDGGRRGFWHTAWPYILGGAALAAGSAAIYLATRSGDDVDVTGVRVVTH